MTSRFRVAAAPILFCLGSATAQAGPISADFRSEFDLPQNTNNGARVFQNLVEPVSGTPDLDKSHQISNTSNFRGYATTDLTSAGLITLTGNLSEQTRGDYDLAVFTISNILFDAGESIVGVHLLTNNLLSSTFGSGSFSPSIAFNANSVTISYDSSGAGSVADFAFSDGGTSTFQLLTEVWSVPAPATLPLMLLAVATVSLLRRRRRI